MSKSEFDYELEAKEYLTHLSPHAQKLAMKAIEDCFALGRNWRWIATALNKKSYSNYERWHFGLFFSKNFDLSVRETMRREDEAESNDLDTFFSVLEDSYSFEFPSSIGEHPSSSASTQEQEIEQLPVFYHANGIDTEEYAPYKFSFYDQILAEAAFEKNLPAILYGKRNNEIPQQYIPYYEEALTAWEGGSDE